MGQESYIPWPELIKILHDHKSCRDRDDTIDLLQILVREFKHARCNEDISEASYIPQLECGDLVQYLWEYSP